MHWYSILMKLALTILTSSLSGYKRSQHDSRTSRRTFEVKLQPLCPLQFAMSVCHVQHLTSVSMQADPGEPEFHLVLYPTTAELMLITWPAGQSEIVNSWSLYGSRHCWNVKAVIARYRAPHKIQAARCRLCVCCCSFLPSWWINVIIIILCQEPITVNQLQFVP